ncbi:MAG: hypothetical protein ABSD49_08815 [Candidatus Bathyarchaeia archaeon]
MDRVGRFCLVGCIYGLLVWGYVVALQVRRPNWVYDVLATWLPIRLDYFGEIGFVASFLFAMVLVVRRDRK